MLRRSRRCCSHSYLLVKLWASPRITALMRFRGSCASGWCGWWPRLSIVLTISRLDRPTDHDTCPGQGYRGPSWTLSWGRESHGAPLLWEVCFQLCWAIWHICATRWSLSASYMKHFSAARKQIVTAECKSLQSRADFILTTCHVWIMWPVSPAGQ